MKTWRKKAIRELSEVNNFALHWDRYAMIVTDNDRQLRITPAEKDKHKVIYSTPEVATKYKIEEAGLFDTFFSFAYNCESSDLKPKYPVISLAMLAEVERPTNFWQGQVAKALNENKSSDGLVELGGNRILLSIYRSYLVLEDDLLIYGTNVYNIENQDLQHWLHAHAR